MEYILGFIVFCVLYSMVRSGDRDNHNEDNRQEESHNRNSNSGSCNHDWVFSHKGADRVYPRYHYNCSLCGKHGIAENKGDPIK